MSERYIRQMALPEIGLVGQERIAAASVLLVGAGGLGSVVIPYLAGAGVGTLHIFDHDDVDVSNLARQTIYKDHEAGHNKAKCAAAYARDLNPTLAIAAVSERATEAALLAYLRAHPVTLLLDGSDNFETKAMLNSVSVAARIPLISASVNQFNGQVGVFRGYDASQPCYRCLFPDFPSDARNCNEAGILGTAAGLIGMMQAHMALAVLTGMAAVVAQPFWTMDMMAMRFDRFALPKDQSCPHCAHGMVDEDEQQEEKMIPLIDVKNLNDEDTVLIDVRQPEELVADPVHHEMVAEDAMMHIPLPEFVARIGELPDGKRLAFLCAGNVRSRQAAEYLAAQGRENVCVLDKFSL